MVQFSCLREDTALQECNRSVRGRLYGRAELDNLLCPYVFPLPCR